MQNQSSHYQRNSYTGVEHMPGFTKLFSSIVTSTVWQEDSDTRVIWVTMLAMADARGIVEGSIPGFAHLCRVSIEAMERAILKFTSPDPYSRTKDFDGRRLEVIDGGWRVINYQKYREKRDSEERKKQTREATARWRQRIKNNDVSQCEPKVSQGEPGRAQAEAEADIKNKRHMCKSEKEICTEFDVFYDAYPKHRGRKDALKAWMKLDPNPELQVIILNAVKVQSNSEEWKRDTGKYIPHPATWLNGEKWTDKVQEVKPKW